MWPQVLFQEERRTLQNDGSDCRQNFGIFLLIPHMAASATPQQWTLGIVFIVLVAAIWAAASVATQFIYTNLCFDQPFVLTYVCTSLFALYLPGWGALSAIGAVKRSCDGLYMGACAASPLSLPQSMLHSSFLCRKAASSSLSSASHAACRPSTHL